MSADLDALVALMPTAGALVTFLGLPEGASTATITSTSQLFRPVRHGAPSWHG
jgi:hypothetical protein